MGNVVVHSKRDLAEPDGAPCEETMYWQSQMGGHFNMLLGLSQPAWAFGKQRLMASGALARWNDVVSVHLV